MKIFNKSNGWGEKVNFVDENNLVLGYDLSQCCCEQADWFITKTEKPTEAEFDAQNQTLEHVEDFRFDRDFFTSNDHLEGQTYNRFDAGGMATFRLVNGDEEAFLHLFNCHNGYYSHGFTFSEGEKVLQEDSL